MAARFGSVLSAIVLLATATAAQVGWFGPITGSIKAGDVAPDLTFEKILSSPNSAAWTPANFRGQVTFISFFPDTTDIPEAVAAWNARVAEFAAKPVQFVWITGEDESTLDPFLAQHPLKGWVLFDPDGATGRSYGEELPMVVIVGPDERVMGFSSETIPSARTLDAVLEGRVTTTPPDSEDSQAFAASRRLLLRAGPVHVLHDSKPVAPSYDVHIFPSNTEGIYDFGGDKFRSLRGFDLKLALTMLYGVGPKRMEIAQRLDDGKRYDISLVVPDYESPGQMRERMREGILRYFGLTERHESRPTDVYVVTAPNPKMKSSDSNSGGEFSSMDLRAAGVEAPVPLESIRDFAGDMSMDAFCELLETNLDRPVVNETNLQGEFHIEATQDGSKDFVTRLREQTGIVVTPSQRSIDFVIIQ